MSINKRTGEGSPRRRIIARHEIRHLLRQRIVGGECPPGSKLIQQQLAKDFGVSMGVVREALLELQAWGLVETHDNRGIFVREWNVERVLEAYDVREGLEGLAARKCSGKLDEYSLDRLGELAEEIYGLAQKQEWDRSAKRDREFHHRIVQLSASHTLLRLTDNYRFVSKVFWLGRPGGAAETRESHLQILDLIRRNLPEAAERAAREHVARGRRLIEELAAHGKFDPHWLV